MKVGQTYFSASRKNSIESLGMQMRESKKNLKYKKDKNELDKLAKILFGVAKRYGKLIFMKK